MIPDITDESGNSQAQTRSLRKKHFNHRTSAIQPVPLIGVFPVLRMYPHGIIPAVPRTRPDWPKRHVNRSFGDAIQAARLRHNIHEQKELGKRAAKFRAGGRAVDKETISRLENGDSVGLEVLYAVVDALSLTMAEVFAERDATPVALRLVKAINTTGQATAEFGTIGGQGNKRSASGSTAPNVVEPHLQFPFERAEAAKVAEVLSEPKQPAAPGGMLNANTGTDGGAPNRKQNSGRPPHRPDRTDPPKRRPGKGGHGGASND